MALRVHEPELSEHGGLLHLQARVHCDALPAEAPTVVRYSVASDSGLSFSTLADTFLVGLLPVAMKLGVPLEIEGTGSTRLAHGALAYQDIQTTWSPDLFQRVPVTIEHLEARREDLRPAGVGCGFSGGIDSFSAVQELRPPHMALPDLQITHAVMVNGFDQIVDPGRTGVAQRMHDVYRAALQPWGVDLVMVHTNLKRFRDAVFERGELAQSFSSPLAACAHALAPVFGRYHLSSHATYAYDDLEPLGSHPMLDHHLSSDQLQILHTGARLSRSEKLERLIEEEAVRNTLRVCAAPPTFDAATGQVSNCGTCLKCVRTIVTLDLLGQLDAFPTFALHEPLKAYQNPRRLARGSTVFLRDLIALAERRGRPDWLRVLRKAAARRRE